MLPDGDELFAALVQLPNDRELHAVTPSPVLYAGLGRLQLLAAPDSYQFDPYDSADAAILYLAPGSLILLPPSHLADGQSITWLRGLDPSADPPDGAELFWTLVDLPANQQLAAPGAARGGLSAAVLGPGGSRTSELPESSMTDQQQLG